MSTPDRDEPPAQAVLVALLRRIADGDRAAFAEFFDLTHAVVVSWLNSAPRGDHDEVLFAVYTRVWVEAPRLPADVVGVWRWMAQLLASVGPARATPPVAARPARASGIRVGASRRRA